MKEGFYFGMKVTLKGEYGIVIKPTPNNEFDNIPGIVRWDTEAETDEEDWRGLYGSFVDAGGKEVGPDYKFRYIDDKGFLK